MILSSVNQPTTLVRSLARQAEDLERRTIIQWLSPLDFFVTQNDMFDKRVEGTGQWVLEAAAFQLRNNLVVSRNP